MANLAILQISVVLDTSIYAYMNVLLGYNPYSKACITLFFLSIAALVTLILHRKHHCFSLFFCRCLFSVSSQLLPHPSILQKSRLPSCSNTASYSAFNPDNHFSCTLQLQTNKEPFTPFLASMMCFGFGSIYGSDDFDSIDGRDSDYWEPNGATSPIAPYQSLYQAVIGIPQEVDYGFHSTCQEDRQYERDVGWNSGNYNTSYYWARYFDGNRPVPCSSVGPFDRLPHYRRDWWYRSLFKEGLTGAYERIGLSFFLGK